MFHFSVQTLRLGVAAIALSILSACAAHKSNAIYISQGLDAFGSPIQIEVLTKSTQQIEFDSNIAAFSGARLKKAGGHCFKSDSRQANLIRACFSASVMSLYASFPGGRSRPSAHSFSAVLMRSDANSVAPGSARL